MVAHMLRGLEAPATRLIVVFKLGRAGSVTSSLAETSDFGIADTLRITDNLLRGWPDK